METLFLGLIVVFQVLTLWIYARERRGLHQDVRTLYQAIARDLNAVTRTIALYAGAEAPIGAPEGEPDPMESARRKAEMWRAMRAKGGSR